jgi:hypothetical protein
MRVMLSNRLWGRGVQRQEERRNRRKEREASSREEETLRNDQPTILQCRSDQERQMEDNSSERNHNNTIDTIKSKTKKRAAVYSDANHLARGSKHPRIVETTKGEKPGVRNPRGVEVVQKASSDGKVKIPQENRDKEVKEERRELEESELQSPEVETPKPEESDMKTREQAEEKRSNSLVGNSLDQESPEVEVSELVNTELEAAGSRDDDDSDYVTVSSITLVSSDSSTETVGLRRVRSLTATCDKRGCQKAGWNLQYKKLRDYHVKHGHCEWFLAFDRLTFILNTTTNTPSVALPDLQVKCHKGTRKTHNWAVGSTISGPSSKLAKWARNEKACSTKLVSISISKTWRNG